MNAFVKLTDKQITRVGRVGEGTYGTVDKAHFHVRSSSSANGRKKMTVAVKQFKVFTNRGTDGSIFPNWVLRELSVLRTIRHVNIIALRSVFTVNIDAGPSVALVFPYAEYDLGVVINHHKYAKTRPKMHLIVSVLYQCLSGLACLHSLSYAHQDIKPQNILIMNNGDIGCGCVKLCDFGLARSLIDSPVPLRDQGSVVTLWYRAPELLLGVKNYDYGVDIWALGCSIAEIIMLQPLFPGKEVSSSTGRQNDEHSRSKEFEWHQMELICEMVPCEFNAGMTKSNHYNTWKERPVLSKSDSIATLLSQSLADDNLSNLIIELLKFNNELRISAKQALEHSLFADEARAKISLKNCFSGTPSTNVPYSKRKICRIK